MKNNIYQKQYLKLIYQWNQKLIYQSRKDNYLLQLKKLNLPQQQLNNLLNLILSFNDTKKELMTVKWLRNGSIILPEDEYKLDKAVQLAERYKLDYQQFSSPMQLINSVSDKEQKYQAVHNKINPDNVPQFSHKVQHGDGIVTYWVEQSKNAQYAVRKMIDQDIGYDANPWCLATRHYGNSLDVAYHAWQRYSAYPKRIAFKNGKLYAFSANDNFNKIVWWNLFDKASINFPDSDITDKDIEYFNKINIIKNYIENLPKMLSNRIDVR